MVKVSIILPVYNVGQYLDETFQSLLNQTLKEIEIIAVNDGSTDHSEEIIKKYVMQDSRISYFFQENQGQSVARNNALKYATGEYIYMMDSDDVLDNPDALSICYDYAEKCKADFIFFDGETLQEEGAMPISWDYHRTQDLEEMKPYSGEFLLNKMLDNSKHNCVVWLLLINHHYLKHINLSFYPGIIHEDELYTLQTMLLAKRVEFIHQTLHHRRLRENSIMTRPVGFDSVFGYFVCLKEAYKFLQKDDYFLYLTIKKPSKRRFSPVFWNSLDFL